MADETVTSPEPEVAGAAKRKSTIDEIEVDLAAPEPPSKRARRAIKKGKPLPPKPSSDDGKDDTKDGEKEKKEKPRSEHGVWIGNLPFTLTSADLRKWLVNNSGGVITDEAIVRIKLPTSKEPGREKNDKPKNKGFAYVDFSDIGGKVAAIALSETELQARRLLIKDAKSFEGRPAKENEADGDAAEGKPEQKRESNASRKIFVGNMGFQTTEDDVRRNFEKCGEIVWVKLATFEDSGKCKGFGWVMFKEPEAAAWAVKGFVKIKEEVETEEDFKDAADEEDDEGNAPKQKEFKTRKWWVNRIHGRNLKLELAEDDQVRYKKRFGKDAVKKAGAEGDARPKNNRPPRNNNREAEGGSFKPSKTTDINVARLTGNVVEHTGTKVTFD
ncbi:hypothetical protein S7711_07011 [Stachybotrys chartarum IBT 7711]|uniref:RRM domain-containing protein n=1 Tax=Stachybotrys chartarum (strain CBS 109288 / IBT 7711) TaxID=1280523 RepID=A0A084AYD6_STACB|nr:hypothetical protein S7711_07011 [Stachybotrys chartarum IBT 7711]KFA48231.1 hypothetical protein S40293_09570 [Stachybotrys chartarum IBT 40293]